MQDYSQQRFLIVDDFNDFLSSVKAMLREMGVRDVDTANRGEDTIAMCRKKRYDIILHDYNLGSGKNGQQVLEELLSLRLISHQCIFVMITAESSQAMVLSALEHEPDAYLTKPFNRASLTQRLDKQMERKTLLRPVLQALDKRLPADVLAACERLAGQDKRLLPLCQRYKAGALRELGRDEELEKLLSGVLAERPIPWAYQALGSLLLRRKAFGAARQLFEQAQQAFPMQPGLYDGLATALAALGESQRAQSVLEDAVRISPLATRRQAQLGKLALANQDFESAGKAYRQAVEQGRHSHFKSPDNYLGLSQALLSEPGEKSLDKRAQAEVNQALAELSSQYADDPGVQVRAQLMKASSAQKSGDKSRADALAAEAVQKMQALPQFFAAETALALAAQLQQLGQAQASVGVLKSCMDMYGDDAEVLKSVAALTDDTDILGGAKEAVAINREGVRAYQKGQLDESLDAFRRALILQPKNISIALNLAQSLLRQGGPQMDEALLGECRRCLDAVSMMPSTDPRYERYQLMRTRVFGA